MLWMLALVIRKTTLVFAYIHNRKKKNIKTKSIPRDKRDISVINVWNLQKRHNSKSRCME